MEGFINILSAVIASGYNSSLKSIQQNLFVVPVRSLLLNGPLAGTIKQPRRNTLAKSREEMLRERELYTENFITADECERRFPGWLASRGINGHTYDPERDGFFCRFQNTPRLVALAPDPDNPGRMIPSFDRVVVEEAPHIHTIGYDIDEEGNYWVGIVYQFRPFIEGQIPPICGDIPMGFNLARVLGDGAQTVYETADDAAARELIEELGVPLREKPVLIRTMIDHTTYGSRTTTPVYKARVNRHLVTGKTDEKEALISEMIPLSEYGHRVSMGTDEDGVLWGFGVSQGSMNLFLLSEGPEAAAQYYGG